MYVFRSSCMALAGLLASSGFALAAERALDPADAKRLVLAGFGDRLRVEAGGADQIEVVLKGERKALDAVRVDRDGDALRVEAGGGDVNSVTRVGSMTVVTTNGGTSSVSIGSGNDTTEGTPPVEVEAKVPKGTDLEVLGFTGKAEIDAVDGSLRLDCVGCTAKAGGAATANLGVTGDGDVSLATVGDGLAVQVTGAGKVEVPKGEVADLRVAIQGDGEVAFMGRAENATVELVGAGLVRLGKVGHLERSVVGAGRIEGVE